MPRKRYNAFEDFPVDKKDQPDWQPAGEQPEGEENQPGEINEPRPAANSLFTGSRVLHSPRCTRWSASNG